jgi:hypothetical protein
VLLAIFVSPLFDLELLFAFADDTFKPRIGATKNELIQNVEGFSKVIRKWLNSLASK